ncbi:hypothetical protein BV20DRAFT_971732 [Pilatotrama ljubarskyi]|nr:hypothetical protein BV20DRAFT_971732 [Pilatotrama ljubarskyi]
MPAPQREGLAPYEQRYTSSYIRRSKGVSRMFVRVRSFRDVAEVRVKVRTLNDHFAHFVAWRVREARRVAESGASGGLSDGESSLITLFFCLNLRLCMVRPAMYILLYIPFEYM